MWPLWRDFDSSPNGVNPFFSWMVKACSSNGFTLRREKPYDGNHTIASTNFQTGSTNENTVPFLFFFNSGDGFVTVKDDRGGRV